MKALTEYGDQVLPALTDLALHPFRPGDQVNLKAWKNWQPASSSLLSGTDPLTTRVNLSLT